MGHSDSIKTQTTKPRSMPKGATEHSVIINRAEYEHLLNQVDILSAHLDNQKREIAHVRQTRDELFVQLTRFNGLRAQIRTLIAVIYDRLITKIQNIGKFKPLIKAPEFNGSYLSGNDLRLAIDKYDEKAFSQKRTIGGGIGRLISIGLLGLIRLTIKFLRLVLRGMRQIKRTIQR